MIKKIITILIVILLPVIAAGERTVLIKKRFINRHKYIIICKGYPKSELSGKAWIESAKEAALINAQVIAKQTFNKTVNVFKNGKVRKYKIFKDYVIIYYIIKYL